MTTFRTTRRHLAPRWLTEGEGELLGYALDLVKDAFAERTRQGLLVRFPEQDPSGTPAPADALASMGRDRRVVRGLNESDASYVVRLKAWLDDRKTAGNPYTLMQRLAEYLGTGVSFRTVDNSGNWFARAADGTRTALLRQANWNWDGSAAAWARFWVVVYGFRAAESTWGAGTWGDGGTWGSTASDDEVATIKAIVNDWKPAGTRCLNVILAFDAASFDPTAPEPDGTWGEPSEASGGTRVKSRLETARYIDGTGA